MRRTAEVAVQSYVSLIVMCGGWACGGRVDDAADSAHTESAEGGAPADGSVGKSSTLARGATAGVEVTKRAFGGSTVSSTSTATTATIGGSSSMGGTGNILECFPPIPTFACGNGKREPGESCDDANAKSGDGCTETCRVEAGYRCPTPGKVCLSISDQSPRCGNGIVETGEACDDGINDGSNEGCSLDCLMLTAYCGDGVKNGTEQCDTGSLNVPAAQAAYGSCQLNCQFGPYCGDGIVQSSEQCDLGKCNGRLLGGYDCDTDCTIAFFIGP